MEPGADKKQPVISTLILLSKATSLGTPRKIWSLTSDWRLLSLDITLYILLLLLVPAAIFFTIWKIQSPILSHTTNIAFPDAVCSQVPVTVARPGSRIGEKREMCPVWPPFPIEGNRTGARVCRLEDMEREKYLEMIAGGVAKITRPTP